MAPQPPDLSTWHAAMRRELVAAAARQQGRRRRRRVQVRLASVAAVAALALLAGLGVRSPDASAEVRVDRSGDELVVTLLELAEDPARLERELREAGVDVALEPVPTGPSGVGRFVGTTDTGGVAAEVHPLEGTARNFTAFRVPARWTGALRLLIGRAARPGEAYTAFTDALAPGEPLAGLPLPGRTAVEALELVADRPWAISFRRLDRPDAPALPRGDLLGPFAGWLVVRADSVAAGEAIVWLVPPGTAADPSGGRPVLVGP